MGELQALARPFGLSFGLYSPHRAVEIAMLKSWRMALNPAASAPTDAADLITRIMARHGASCGMEEFHDAVNVTFHDFESEVYDSEHRDMWESLPEQFRLLAGDCLPFLPAGPRGLTLLDIGAGTGLATESLLRTEMGSRIERIQLLDSSPAMLRRASDRISRWNRPVSAHRGYLASLAQEERFDLIVTSSVLHHVPDLAAFLRDVRARQAEGGIFLHVQDPNGDYLYDADLRRRMQEQSKRLLPLWAYRFTPQRITRGLAGRITGRRGPAYLWKTNRALMDRGIIQTPLSAAELFSITDIHADLGDGEGVSMARMKIWLPDYDCVSQRSYGFFGELKTTLDALRRKTEEDLIAARALNGFHVAAAWKLREVR